MQCYPGQRKPGKAIQCSVQTSSDLEGACSVLVALAKQYCFHRVTAMKEC